MRRQRSETGSDQQVEQHSFSKDKLPETLSYLLKRSGAASSNHVDVNVKCSELRSDSTMIGCLILILLFGTQYYSAAGAKRDLPPTWQVDTSRVYGYQKFERWHSLAPAEPTRLSWSRPEGVVFVTPEELALYQVNDTEGLTPLGPREGKNANRFRLHVTFIDASSGELIDQLWFNTGPGVVAVLPTMDGKFVVQTSDTLRFFASDRRELRSMPLPFRGTAPLEWWDVQVSPSRGEIWIAHHEEFGYGSKVLPKVQMEVLGTKTFSVLTQLKTTVLNDLSVGDGFAVVHNPATGFGPGLLTWDGDWHPIPFSYTPECPNYARALPHKLVAAFGCNRLNILNLDAKTVYSDQLGDKHDAIMEIHSADSLIAARIDKRKSNLFDSGFNSQPSRIVLFDFTQRKVLKSIEVTPNLAGFAVCSDSALATLDGSELRFYRDSARKDK